MKKYLAILPTASSFFLLASQSFAQSVGIKPPSGSITGVAIENIPQFIINFLFIIGIIIAVAFLIYGGIKWILSGGDEKQVEAARNHIIAAIVGLIIVVGAFFIISVVFSILGVANPLNTNGGTFNLPTLRNPGSTQ